MRQFTSIVLFNNQRVILKRVLGGVHEVFIFVVNFIIDLIGRMFFCFTFGRN